MRAPITVQFNRPLAAVALTVAAAVSGIAPAAAHPVKPGTPSPGKPSPGVPRAGAPKQPPASMSTLGGEQLGRPGPQTGEGAPALPAGLSALSWMVSDADTGQVLAANNAHWPLPPASTLKMLFADTVLPAVPGTASHKVEPAELTGMGDGSSAVGIVPGQTYLGADLWRGVFLRSGNDAVHVLASMNGGVPKTVTDMQAKADALGAKDTHVRSPDGYDAEGQVSSAYDLTLFLRSGLRNKDFKEYCATADAKFPGGPNTKGKPFGISNTNRMLSGIDGVAKYPGLIGGKNGYTTHAGNTLAEAATRDGHTILVTVMNPQENKRDKIYTETRALLDWGFAAVGKAKPVGTLDAPKPSAAAKPAATAATKTDSSGMGVLGWTGLGAGAAVAAGVAYVVLKRRPERMRRRG
ncbi:D-alanyl-D-alanine carboxypeptidase [Streptomyces sp. BPTC-684]|uniref:D-alanyl-D-alanine carboxypeptidase family protein n=1 Tax=Streptomyces sp. BPTC-684 TaxID=3043734 RepID=UPI0024B17457|nr:D-alanyl-D-alanine carboxypeptidase [Streptomyces sp. BPTC-684]WHM36528.1 D-alanyl-D-alanine carboxypeptidase [Streptomyces sp. BPTC-684]